MDFLKHEFIKKVSEEFNVSKYNGDGQYKPNKKHTFGMYLDKEWYILRS